MAGRWKTVSLFCYTLGTGARVLVCFLWSHPWIHIWDYELNFFYTREQDEINFVKLFNSLHSIERNRSTYAFEYYSLFYKKEFKNINCDSKIGKWHMRKRSWNKYTYLLKRQHISSCYILFWQDKNLHSTTLSNNEKFQLC